MISSSSRSRRCLSFSNSSSVSAPFGVQVSSLGDCIDHVDVLRDGRAGRMADRREPLRGQPEGMPPRGAGLLHDALAKALRVRADLPDELSDRPAPGEELRERRPDPFRRGSGAGRSGCPLAAWSMQGGGAEAVAADIADAEPSPDGPASSSAAAVQTRPAVACACVRRTSRPRQSSHFMGAGSIGPSCAGRPASAIIRSVFRDALGPGRSAGGGIAGAAAAVPTRPAWHSPSTTDPTRGHPGGARGALARAGARATFFVVGEQVRAARRWRPGWRPAASSPCTATAIGCSWLRPRRCARTSRAARPRGRRAGALAPAALRDPQPRGLAACARRAWRRCCGRAGARTGASFTTPARIAARATERVGAGDVILLHDADFYSASGSHERPWRRCRPDRQCSSRLEFATVLPVLTGLPERTLAADSLRPPAESASNDAGVQAPPP